MNGLTDGQMDGQTDERTENLPILQDSVQYRGRCPKKVIRKNESILGECIMVWGLGLTKMRGLVGECWMGGQWYPCLASYCLPVLVGL